MKMLTKNEVGKIFDLTSWNPIIGCKTSEDGADCLHITNVSPAFLPLSADIEFDGTGAGLIQALKVYQEQFSQDDYVLYWLDRRGTEGVPATIKELAEDAESVQRMYQNLYMQVKGYFMAKKQAEEAYSISYQSYSFPREYILSHMKEFEETLKGGYFAGTFKIMSSLSDVLGKTCTYEDYRAIEQLLLRVYDDADEVERILDNLASLPDQIKKIQAMKNEIDGEV